MYLLIFTLLCLPLQSLIVFVHNLSSKQYFLFNLLKQILKHSETSRLSFRGKRISWGIVPEAVCSWRLGGWFALRSGFPSSSTLPPSWAIVLCACFPHFPPPALSFSSYCLSEPAPVAGLPTVRQSCSPTALHCSLAHVLLEWAGPGSLCKA